MWCNDKLNHRYLPCVYFLKGYNILNFINEQTWIYSIHDYLEGWGELVNNKITTISLRCMNTPNLAVICKHYE